MLSIFLFLFITISTVLSDTGLITFTDTSSLSCISNDVESFLQNQTKDIINAKIETMVIPNVMKKLEGLTESLLPEEIRALLEFSHYKQINIETRRSYFDFFRNRYIVEARESFYKESTDELFVYVVKVEYKDEKEAINLTETLKVTSEAISEVVSYAGSNEDVIKTLVSTAGSVVLALLI